MTDLFARTVFRPLAGAALLAGACALSARADAPSETTLALDFSAGLDYGTAKIVPKVANAPEGATLTLVTTDSVQARTTESGLSTQAVTRAYGNRTPGRSLVVDGYVVSSGGATTNAAVHDLFVMGRVHDDDWLYEDAGTFTNATGRGFWDGLDYATVAGDRIRIDTRTEDSTSAVVTCTIGHVPAPSRGYTISTKASFPHPHPYGELPDPSRQRLGLAVGSPDEDRPDLAAFFYVESGVWKAVPVAVCDPLVSAEWQIHISVDCDTQAATYFVRASDGEPWTILGTAGGVGETSVSEASFRGEGEISGLAGNGFDTQLVDVKVEFSDRNLHPGVNFEETVVTGRITSTTVHESSTESYTCKVRLKSLDGTVIESSDYSFRADGFVDFCVRASNLTAGAAYTAEVVLDSKSDANSSGARETAFMSRALTNELWGTTGQWVCENAKTFDGLAPGTGVWDGRDHASTTQGWILVETDLSDEQAAGRAVVSFTPTNALGETASEYVASVRAVFSDAVSEPADTNALFGFTVARTDDGYRFLCLSNGVWQTVPGTVAEPVLGEEYVFFAYVQMQKRALDCLVRDASGNETHLMSVTLDAGRADSLFARVDVCGRGYVTDLLGSVHSSYLLRINPVFDDDTLYPGTNFTATTANGTIRFDPLWETDHTNGQLSVVVRNESGLVIGRRRINFDSLDDRPFDYYISGLTPGENYSVKVEVEMKDVDIGTNTTDYATGLMARIVTNEQWAADGRWIREDVHTFTNGSGTGVWDAGAGYATASGDRIAINTVSSEDRKARVGYVATNPLPEHTGFEIRTRIDFEFARETLPSETGPYGIAIVQYVSETGDTPCQFAVLTNGVWTAVDADVYEPDPSVEYEVTIRADYSRNLATYLVRPASDSALPYPIVSYEIGTETAETPYKADFYGKGYVRTHEGDGFDVSLVEISAEVDTGVLAPGTNFASTVAAGVLRIRQIWATDRNSGSYTITARDSAGNEVASAVMTYQQLTNQNFNVCFDGLTAGEIYDVEIVADLDGEVVLTDSVPAVMGRRIGGWIRENPATFLGEETGTGHWLQTNETASVVDTGTGRAIRVSVNRDDLQESVVYDPTNDTMAVRMSTIREVRLNLDFRDIGWYASDDRPPAAPSNALAGATVWCDDTADDRVLALAVVGTNGEWTVAEGTRRSALLDGNFTVIMRVDSRAGIVRYDLASATATNKVYQCGYASKGFRRSRLSFEGEGYVYAVDGDTYDPNLIRSSTNEFADLDTAILGTLGQDETLAPLWPADQLVTVGRGQFRVSDPDNWLNVRFPWWYYFEVSTNGTVRVYRFNQSNNWIDYAEGGETNLVVTAAPGGGSLYFVKTPEGLSWIAAQATNEWISGRIELATNIDLTAHNWTPIAGFSGEFDGRGRTISGLNNTNCHVGIPGGVYVGGPTNAWGRSAYGLFSTATNATLSDVTFAGVAISNLADSVAALAGALAGNCTVSNVTVESGSVLGLGGTVAGLAGFADFADFLTFVNNTNGAAVAAANSLYGEGRWAAGLLCVGGPTDGSAALGTVVVTNNANFGTVANTIYDSGLLGGNVAQILAGTTLGARFGEVYLTNNVAAGSVDAQLVRSPENEVVETNCPAVNLAPAFWGLMSDGTFYRYLEANAHGAVAVDPHRRTARMLSGTFPNGTENPVGFINDRITSLLPGPDTLVTMPSEIESWGPIVIDRDLTFDLGGRTLNTIYIDNPFVISNGVTATIRNGEIIVGLGEDDVTPVEPFVGDTSHLTTNNLTVTAVPETFFERTTLSVNGMTMSVLYSAQLAEALNSSASVIQLYEGNDVTIDVDAGVLKVGDHVVARLADCYGFKATVDEDGNASFSVRIADSAAPTAEFAMEGGETGTVTVSVGNARNGFYYALQHKPDLASEWITPPESEWVRATDGGASITAPKDGAAGFYRVLMTDVLPGAGSDE